jgi:hypothetical protein
MYFCGTVRGKIAESKNLEAVLHPLIYFLVIKKTGGICNAQGNV